MSAQNEVGKIFLKVFVWITYTDVGFETGLGLTAEPAVTVVTKKVPSGMFATARAELTGRRRKESLNLKVLTFRYRLLGCGAAVTVKVCRPF